METAQRMPAERTQAAAEIRQLTALRAARAAGSVPLARPSAYWLDFIEKFAYLFELSDASLKHLRYHTYNLTSDNYQRYYFGSREDEERLTAKYLELRSALGDNGLLEPPLGIGYAHADGLISWDVLRYMSVLRDLVHAHAVTQPASIVEIGGGYGGLCRVVLSHCTQCAYTIVDLEEVLFFSKCYLDETLPGREVRLVHSVTDLSFDSGCINLIPQCLLEDIDAKFDLAINHQSMQEMQAAQVQRYLRFIASRCAKFYCRNLKRHDVRLALEKGLSIDVHSQVLEHLPSIRWKGDAVNPEADLLDEHLLRVVVARDGAQRPAAPAPRTVPAQPGTPQLKAQTIHTGEMVEVVPLQNGATFTLEVSGGCDALTLLIATWGTVVDRLEMEVIVRQGEHAVMQSLFTCLDAHDWQELAFDLRAAECSRTPCTIGFTVRQLLGSGKLGLPLFTPASDNCAFAGYPGRLVPAGQIFVRE